MPAGDAGRPYGTPTEENAWDVANELRSENGRLQVQLAAQQAVVDAAREFVDNDPCRYDHNDYCQTHYGQRPCHMERLRAALKVQAAQPEGEQG